MLCKEEWLNCDLNNIKSLGVVWCERKYKHQLCSWAEDIDLFSYRQLKNLLSKESFFKFLFFFKFTSLHFLIPCIHVPVPSIIFLHRHYIYCWCCFRSTTYSSLHIKLSWWLFLWDLRKLIPSWSCINFPFIRLPLFLPSCFMFDRSCLRHLRLVLRLFHVNN